MILSHLVDKAPEVLTIKTVNPAIGLPRRHVNTLLPYVATRLFSSTCDGCLVADKILTKDFDPYDKTIKVPDHGFSFANTYPFTDCPIDSEGNFLRREPILYRISTGLLDFGSRNIVISAFPQTQ